MPNVLFLHFSRIEALVLLLEADVFFSLGTFDFTSYFRFINLLIVCFPSLIILP